MKPKSISKITLTLCVLITLCGALAFPLRPAQKNMPVHRPDLVNGTNGPSGVFLNDRRSAQSAPVNACGVSIAHDYAGLNFNQSGGYVPPDTCGAAGPSSYVETVNQEIAIYSPKSTGATSILDSLGDFFFTQGGLSHASMSSALSQPIVIYDELMSRFIVGDQDIDFTTHVSNFVIAVSKTSTPATLTAADWNFYAISTSEMGYDADFPGNVGYNADAFVFTLNMFAVAAGSNHVLITTVNAIDLANGVSQASLQTFHNDFSGFSLRPATMHGSISGDPLWFVTEHGNNTSIDVVKMENVLSNSAIFSTTSVPVAAYSTVVPPRNPDGTVITNSIDSRILKAAQTNGSLVATHHVAVSATQDVVRWYRIDTSSGTPSLIDEGDVTAGVNNTYLYFPAIDINPSGSIGLTFMRSGTDSSTDYMSMYVTGRAAADPAGTMQTPFLVSSGTGLANYSDFGGGRAGALSGINVDPVDGSFWAANEYATSKAGNPPANWGTAIANFTISTLVVTTLVDEDDGDADPTHGTGTSLREAINAANANADPDVICFAVTGTITLNANGTLPALNSDMKILGPGANALTVKRDPAAANFRIFTVNNGKTVTISGLTIRNGSGTGGILNGGTLTVTNSALSGNSATSQGGGIANQGTLTVTNSTLSGNSAGVGLGFGGGIYNPLGGIVTITNSTLSGNSAGSHGGGFYNQGTLTVTNSTLSDNGAGNFGGSFHNQGTLTIGSTILKPGSVSSPVGTVISNGYNLCGDNASTFLNQATDQNSTDPMLDPNGLQDNGGPTLTIALQPGSPAIDKGKNFSGSTTDQRGPGFARTYDSGVPNASGGDGTDIGAFEVQNTPPTITAATISRQQGAASSNSQIATVSDSEDPLTALTVTVNGDTSATMNGVTVSNIAVTNSGNVTADVVASCSAANAGFTLRVTDPGGLFAEATLTVNVSANTTPPVITPKAPIVIQQATNHGYRTFTIAQMVQSATDDCDGNLISNVVIEKATSDEVENSPGPGDGNTLNDIVIAANCKSVQLRAERDGTMNGRVYLVTLRVSDGQNIARATYRVSVPVGRNAAVDSGVHYTVNGTCP